MLWRLSLLALLVVVELLLSLALVLVGLQALEGDGVLGEAGGVGDPGRAGVRWGRRRLDGRVSRPRSSTCPWAGPISPGPLQPPTPPLPLARSR